MKRRHYFDGIDYHRQAGKRKKVAHYLKATNFRKLAGTQVFHRQVARRRIYLTMTAIAIFLLGIWFVIF